MNTITAVGVTLAAASLCIFVIITQRRQAQANRDFLAHKVKEKNRKYRQTHLKTKPGLPLPVEPRAHQMMMAMAMPLPAVEGKQTPRPAVRVLSIDGGGIRGIIPAKILTEIEKRTGKRIHEMFHFITGTSTGGVLAAGLAKKDPLTAQQCLDLYADSSCGKRVFHAGAARKLLSKLGLQASYDASSIEGILHEKFLNADGTRSKLSETIVPLMAVAYDLNACDPYFFKSWKAQGVMLKEDEEKEHFDFYLEEVVRSTSAAPTYFDPKEVSPFGYASEDPPRYRFVDGGVVANDPLACAYASIKSAVQDEMILEVVSLGTGQQSPQPYKLANGGLTGWAKPITSVMMSGSGDIVAYQMTHALAKDKFFRINALWDKEVAMDDISPANVNFLIDEAQKLIDDHHSGFQEVIEMLKEPLTPLPGFLKKPK